MRAVLNSKTVENQGFRANGHQIRILLIEICLHASFQPKRTQPAHVFINFSKNWYAKFWFGMFFSVFSFRRPKIPSPNDSPHQKASNAPKISSIGWIFDTFVSKKLCKMKRQNEKRLFGITVKHRERMRGSL